MRSSSKTPVYCGGQVFNLSRSIAVTLEPFDEDPGLLKNGYVARTRCAPASFETFQSFLDGGDIRINRNNALDLISLAREFGVPDLESKVIDFVNSDRPYFHFVRCEAKLNEFELRMETYRNERLSLRGYFDKHNKNVAALDERQEEHSRLLKDAAERVRGTKESLKELKAQFVRELADLRNQITRIRELVKPHASAE